MQPQVSLTSGRAHTRAAPGDAPGFHMFVCLFICRAVDRQVIHACHGFNGDEYLLHTLSP